MMQWATLGFQNGASPIQEHMIYFYDYSTVILILIISVVSYMMVSSTLNSFSNRNLLEGQTIELIWTVLPAMVLVLIALPSLRLLYLTDACNNPDLTVKVIGHQWYWSYECFDLGAKEFDSYMIPTPELAEGGFRLLEVDNRMVIPLNSSIRMLISSGDVLHSWTVPALGVKADAVPGRLNQISFSCLSPGLFYGQCSEICGVNHSFMPIVLESVDVSTFKEWALA
uniref:Cytochrome c oxidase subunit 2 n=1 Tax=Orthione mesoamericana TaxID=2480053 RepID=A0A8K1Y3I4_9CRUS|nr:cytochrome c oxidase subunit II [Orthione mesoamericana]